MYEFWGDRISDVIRKKLEGVEECIVVNTASAEYFKAVREERVREGVTIVEVSRVGGGREGRKGQKWDCDVRVVLGSRMVHSVKIL